MAYFMYVDNTFTIFQNEADSNSFFYELNRLHPSLKFLHPFSTLLFLHPSLFLHPLHRFLHPSLNFTFKKEKNIICCFSMSVWNEQTLGSSKPECIANLTSAVNTYVGNLSAPTKMNSLVSTQVHCALIISTKSRAK